MFCLAYIKLYCSVEIDIVEPIQFSRKIHNKKLNKVKRNKKILKDARKTHKNRF